MEFRNTSEFVYLSTLNDLHEVLLNMLGQEMFTEIQLKKLIPHIDFTNEILNMDKKKLNEEVMLELRKRLLIK